MKHVEAWQREAPSRYIAGWKGLTSSIILQLGVDLDEAIETDGDNTIPYDPELAVDLWRFAHPEKFSGPIINFSREMLAADEVQKKSGLTASGS